jgi:hypothetical protein
VVVGVDAEASRDGGDRDEEQSDELETSLWSTSLVVARNNEEERPEMTQRWRDPVDVRLVVLKVAKTNRWFREVHKCRGKREGPESGGG